MNNNQNAVSHTTQQESNEIDLINVIIKIWKWKWLTAILVILVTAATFLFVLISPVPPKTYTVKTSLRIGIVGTYPLQDPEAIVNSIKTKLFTQAHQQSLKITDATPISTPSNNPYNISKFDATVASKKGQFIFAITSNASKKLIEFSIQTPSANESVKWARMIGDSIISDHRPFYNNAVKQAQAELSEIRRMPAYVDHKYIATKMLFENQKYPTDYIVEPYAPSEPDAIFEKKIAKKTLIAFISSMIFGIFLSFLLDYILELRREIKQRSGRA